MFYQTTTATPLRAFFKHEQILTRISPTDVSVKWFHFTVSWLVVRSLNGSEARVDFVMKQTLLLFKFKLISTECRKTKTKPITYRLDYSANLKP